MRLGIVYVVFVRVMIMLSEVILMPHSRGCGWLAAD